MTLRYSLALAVLVMGAGPADANDLLRYYELARSRDTTLQAAQHQRDAAIEVRPQALSQLLPQISATGSATRENVDYAVSYEGIHASDCALSANASMQRCYGTAHGVALTLTQTLWSYQAFSLLKEANFQAAAAEATWQGAQENLVLRVAVTYFGILSARDQLATNRSEREAFASLLNQARARQQTGVGPRSDVEQAQSFYDATEQGVIDAENALDDANLALTEIIGPHSEEIAAGEHSIGLSRARIGRCVGGFRAGGQFRCARRGAQSGGRVARHLGTARQGPADLLVGRFGRAGMAGRGARRQSIVRYGRRLLQLAALPERCGGLGGAAVESPLP
jgi:outer membrane protein TolC